MMKHLNALNEKLERLNSFVLIEWEARKSLVAVHFWIKVLYGLESALLAWHRFLCLSEP